MSGPSPRRVPPDGVTVTAGSVDDVERLEPLWLEVHAVHQAVDPELAPWVDDATTWRKRRELYHHCLEQPDSFLLLAARGDDLVGYAMVTVEPDGDVLWNDSWVVGEKVAELETLAVRAGERDQGIGSCLLDAVDEELERRGIHDVVIGAVPGNEAAIRLYERRGFRPNWLILSRFESREAEQQA